MTDAPRSNAVSPVVTMGSGGPDLTRRSPEDGTLRSFEEYYDTQFDVEQDPYGAWDSRHKLSAQLNKKYDDIGEMYIQKAELEARLLDVSKREAAMIARYDAKLEATEARAEAAEARLKEGAAILDRAVNGVWRDGDLELARAFLASMVDKP